MIVAAGKQVGFATNGLTAMLQDKFDQAVACIQMATSPYSSLSKRVVASTPIIQLPLVNIIEQLHTCKGNVKV